MALSRRRSGIALLLCLLCLVGCAERAASMGDIALGGDPVSGKQLVEHFECNRCHQPRMDVDGRNCLSCHTAIGRQDSRALPGYPSLVQVEEWSRKIQHYREVPSLHAVGKLLRSDWIVKFLLAPHDLRPRLGESMPRLSLSESDARDIAAYLASAERKEPYFADARIADYTRDWPPLTKGDPAAGADLYQETGCNACHLFSGTSRALNVTPDRLEARSLMLAVDLRHTRDRFQVHELVPWILAPRHHKVDAVMPNLELSYQQARDLAAFIMTEPLAAKPPVPRVKRLPTLDRPVSFDEVWSAVFGKTCVHCHDDTDLGVLGDGGPGNVGGFGFPAKRISFADYESIFAGYVDKAGKRRSLFEKTEDGTVLLVKTLLIRRDEEAGYPDERHRGMPLSLPSVSAEELQLVETWIKQGRPR